MSLCALWGKDMTSAGSSTRSPTPHNHPLHTNSLRPEPHVEPQSSQARLAGWLAGWILTADAPRLPSRLPSLPTQHPGDSRRTTMRRCSSFVPKSVPVTLRPRQAHPCTAIDTPSRSGRSTMLNTSARRRSLPLRPSQSRARPSTSDRPRAPSYCTAILRNERRERHLL